MTPQLWETLNEAIVVCTDLILATFFTILALLVSTYYLLPEFFGSSEEVHALPPPVQEVGEEEHRQLSRSDENTEEEELKQFDDSDPKAPLVSCSYDVFLSFRGETRNNFTGHLYTYLNNKGVKTFIDDEELRVGEEISSSLVKAIQGSKISIVIFSENYASSRWCLDELVEILQCMESNQQVVWPVFYKVDPSNVRHQRGKYGDDFAKHEFRFKDKMDKVSRWRRALTDAANLKGWHFSDDMHEASFINKIAEAISAQLAGGSYLNVAKFPVGIESRVQDVLELLDVGGGDVRMVGVWGIGGIGKSSTAKAIYNKIRHKFEGSCFLANVRTASVPHLGLARLQNDLLNQILGGEKLEMTDSSRGIQVIKERLNSKRVLIVLDDVNEMYQLDNLTGGLDWFGRGSRIIITTRDKGLLSHPVNAIYTAVALTDDEARNLFTLNAFKGNKNPDEFEKFPIASALHYAQGLPLAINILGSHLRGKSINQWHATIEYFRKFPNRDIQTVLEISYNALEEPLKEAFLDIACFFKGKHKEYVAQALNGSYITPEHAIEVLEEKALISIDDFSRIWMHDLLEDMGKQIVHKESPEYPGRRSRIWFHEDVYDVLTENTGSEEVKGIRVELPREEEICLSSKCFKKMKNLQLFININARFSGELHYFPNQLRFLDWPEFPGQVLPSDFNPRKLVKLSIPNSRISRLGQGLRNLQNLKSLSFQGCKLLKEVPDLSGRFPNLEELNLSYCTSLIKLHDSVGCLGKLVDLNLQYCSNLKKFPKIVNMKSLRDMKFGRCERLENFPEIVGRMEFLRSVNVSGTAIKVLPLSIGYDLFNLKMLDASSCGHLTKLPLSIFEMQNLYILELTGCRNLELTSTSNSKNPHKGKAISSENESDMDRCGYADQASSSKLTSLLWFSATGFDNSLIIGVLVRSAVFLTHLDLSYGSFVSLPAGLAKFIKLEVLILYRCHRLKEVVELPPNLQWLDVNGCVSLEKMFKLSESQNIEEWKMLKWLDMGHCWRLYDNLVKEAAKRFNHHNQSCLFSLSLSCQKSTFQAVLPGHEIPKWFSCQIDFKSSLLEFEIQVLDNFQWEKTGLALCIAGVQGFDWGYGIFFNGELVAKDYDLSYSHLKDREKEEQVSLVYIPLNGIAYRPLPPFRCRVYISPNKWRDDVGPMECCGVHLVMPPDEEECMKLVYAKAIRHPFHIKSSLIFKKNQLIKNINSKNSDL